MAINAVLLVGAAAYFVAVVESAVAVNDVAFVDGGFVSGDSAAIKAVAVVAHGSLVVQPITQAARSSAIKLKLSRQLNFRKNV